MPQSRVVVPLLLLGLALTAATARADGATQRALIASAEAFEAASRPELALSAWQEALLAEPGSRLARRCEARISYLNERREGGFVPLADLMRMQHLGSAGQSRARIVEFESSLIHLPRGVVRKESRMLVAEAWAHSIGDARQAVRAYETLLRTEDLDDNERHAAWSALATLHSSLGETRQAEAMLSAAGLQRTPAGAAIQREGTRVVGRIVALTFVIGFALIVTFVIVRARLPAAAFKRVFTMPGIVAALFIALVPMLVARAYDEAATDTFGLLALCVLLLLAASRLVGEAFDILRPRRALVSASAVAAALAVLSAGYLLLDRAGGLIGIGL